MVLKRKWRLIPPHMTWKLETRLGVGYKPNKIGSQKNNQRKFYTLQGVFHNARYKDEDHMAVIKEEDEGIPNLVCRCSSDTTLNNLKATEI